MDVLTMNQQPEVELGSTTILTFSKIETSAATKKMVNSAEEYQRVLTLLAK